VPFPKDAVVVVKQVDDQNWEVREILRYRANREVFEVPVGQGTDFASVPRPFIWFLPRYGAYTMAAILHDYLWRVRAATGKMRWIEADGVFRKAMRELRVPSLRRWIMWGAVRWAALFKPGGRSGWIREAPRVLLMTLVAAPFVVIPGVVIVLSLAAFFLLELLTWVPLQLVAVGKARLRKGAPRKEVILPRLDLSTAGRAPTVSAPASEGSPPD
jgi:Protein of unknown function (DUF1353)